MVEVEVEFDYDAELADELTIRSGEIIAEVKQMDGGWWEGSLRGRRGLFPDNFVQILNKDGVKASRKPSLSLSSSVDDELDEDDLEDVQLRPKNPPNSKSAHKRQCRVLFSYSPAHEDELELKLDEMVDFLGEVEDGWWKGQLNGKTGVFPSNFVEMASKTSATMEEEAEKNVEKKNQKNDSKLRGAEEPKVVEMGRTKITNLIQEAESKVKPGQLPISAFELKHNQKEQASVASLDPPPVSAVNTVVIQNHNLFVKNSKGVAPMPNNPERQRRQSPLGRESKNKSDLKASSERQPTMSGLAAPKLPPKPVPCRASPNHRFPPPNSRREVRHVEEFLLAEVGNQFESNSSPISETSPCQFESFRSSPLATDSCQTKSGFFRRLAMAFTRPKGAEDKGMKKPRRIDEDSISLIAPMSFQDRCQSTLSLRSLLHTFTPRRWSSRMSKKGFSSQESLPGAAISLANLSSSKRRKREPKVIHRSETVPDLNRRDGSHGSRERPWRSTPRRRRPDSIQGHRVSTWKTLCASSIDLGSVSSGSTESFLFQEAKPSHDDPAPDMQQAKAKFPFNRVYEARVYEFRRKCPQMGLFLSIPRLQTKSRRCGIITNVQAFQARGHLC